MKIIVLSCYFGKIHNIQNWINSCSYNPDIDFVLFTDDKNIAATPKNVRIIKMTLRELKDKIEKKLKIKTNITTPYKLCDYKPLYGFIFEEYLKGYDFWGYCDTDLIFGNIHNFISGKILNKFDRIYVLGHFSLYRNTDKMIQLFKQNDDYIKMCKTSKNMIYDEIGGINSICEKADIRWYKNVDYADINPNIKRLTLAKQDERVTNHRKNYKYQLFAYVNGEVIRYYVENNTIKKDSFAYIHYSGRKYKTIESNSFIFSKKKLIASDNEIEHLTINTIKKYNRSHGLILEFAENMLKKYYKRFKHYKRFHG